mmetsp:Transcript_31623/g.71129  ORF Transcript_31623/g.71129 Transcript_31623/m.71129 type:complete len:211 (-) Transcript_31623:3-635(-)
MCRLLQLGLALSVLDLASSFINSPYMHWRFDIKTPTAHLGVQQKFSPAWETTRARTEFAHNMKPDRMKDDVAGFVSGSEINIEDLIREADLGLSESEMKKIRALRLQQEAHDAIIEARAARHKADIMKQNLLKSKEVGPLSNGLSDRIAPLSMKINQRSFEYLSSCPIRELKAALEETKCVLFQKIGTLEPRDLLILGVILYIVSILQLQ